MMIAVVEDKEVFNRFDGSIFLEHVKPVRNGRSSESSRMHLRYAFLYLKVVALIKLHKHYYINTIIHMFYQKQSE